VDVNRQNEAAWDLAETPEAFEQLTNSARDFLIEPEKLLTTPFHYRVIVS
jgi:hypothetical protein